MNALDKKEIILKAASQCFARYGFDKTTLDDIGKAVGLNKATLYYYYKNKEEIFTEVVLVESKEYINSLQMKAATGINCHEQITAYLIERLRYYQKVVNLHQLTLDSLQQVEPLFDQLYKSVLDQEILFVKNIIEACIENGNFIAIDSFRLAQTLFTVADAVKHKFIKESNVRFASDINYQSIEDEITFIITHILNGIKSSL